jgi:hypothetical protein
LPQRLDAGRLALGLGDLAGGDLVACPLVTRPVTKASVELVAAAVVEATVPTAAEVASWVALTASLLVPGSAGLGFGLLLAGREGQRAHAAAANTEAVFMGSSPEESAALRTRGRDLGSGAYLTTMTAAA